ncbi:MAG: Rpn family recombination-promoting nuclease/putative transposase [Desulfovibrio sp.]|nr:Rpn family recombination-promoting nuclease/putative transposase [Desulfovibrio sp.]
MKQEIIPPKYDFMFKRLFGDRDNTRALVDFLKAVLDFPGEEYRSLTFVDPNLYPRYWGGKRFVLDLKLETDFGNIIDIEIQLSDTDEMKERIIAYESRMISDQLKEGEIYKALTKAITILIADFTLIENIDDYHQKFMIRNDSGNVILSNIFEIHTIELTKVPPAEDGHILWRWLKLLKATHEEELDMLQQHYPDLQEPIVRIKELSADELMREERLAYEKARRDEAARLYSATRDGEARGEARGEVRGRAAVALSMLQEGMPLSQVARLTGLAVEEIEKLKEQLHR